ncbi:hypothetical protein FH972_021788 [Carpinus fangiana]|uniref:1-alkyl-2-acetylglycerophosphocholine esterase n=1 Tax=Carpinus fangiana TaxID=176857 RepID=A0A5N6KQZ7_9ROSI|nr:hypothetical protein FH972_021788 [Carpinus fangiana]
MAAPQRDSKKPQALRAASGYGSTPVPGAKEPKSRPPKSIRDKLGMLQAHLPYYSGPYSVGTMEIEVPARNPRHFSEIKRNHRHLLQLETVLMTVFYPGAHGSGHGKPPYGGTRWSRETWLPRPRLGTATGYGQFAGIGSLGIPLFAITSMFTKLPAYRNAPLATHWPPNFNLRTDGADAKNQSGPTPPGGSVSPVFPLLIFSHGLGGTRTMYSELCGEFASYGMVVVAVEHRDGSGPRSYVNRGPKETDTKPDGKDTESHTMGNSPEDSSRKGEKVDYIFPKDNPLDTSPNNDKGVDVELRAAQIALRLAEIEEAYNAMCEITAGKGKEEIYDRNLRRKGFRGASSIGLDGIDWNTWTSAFHTEGVTILGHSFGAATAIEALRQPERFHWVKQAVIYDIWGAAVRAADAQAKERSSAKSGDSCQDQSNDVADHVHSTDAPGEDKGTGTIALPLLAINSEAFSYWASNFSLVESLAAEAAANAQPAWLLTVRGTVHVSQSDFALLYPRLCSVFLKMTAHPRRALDINVDATLEFLRLVAPHEHMLHVTRAAPADGVLRAPLQADGDGVSLHRPASKYIAARLRIPHEMSYRFRPGRRARRKKLVAEAKASDEVWMHFKPAAETLRRFGLDVDGDGKDCAYAAPPEARAPRKAQDQDGGEGGEWAKEGDGTGQGRGTQGEAAQTKGTNVAKGGDSAEEPMNTFVGRVQEATAGAGRNET